MILPQNAGKGAKDFVSFLLKINYLHLSLFGKRVKKIDLFVFFKQKTQLCDYNNSIIKFCKYIFFTCTALYTIQSQTLIFCLPTNFYNIVFSYKMKILGKAYAFS